MNSTNVQLGVIAFIILISLTDPLIMKFRVWLWEKSIKDEYERVSITKWPFS